MLVALVALLLLPAGAADLPLAVARVAEGLNKPVGVKFDPRNTAHVVEQHGRVRVVEKGGLRKEPFLDLSDRVTRFMGASEQGLLDIAFHPDYASNGRVFAHYTDLSGDTVVSEFRAKDGQADPATERVILAVDQPYSNHNGGQIEFGPDGFLYVALGDGGSGGDPKGNGQSRKTLLGKLLRLDVSTRPFRVPESNPFARVKQARPEIWAYGLRNPWRFSFDGDMLYIGDVGQNSWEEIDVEDLRDGGGKNYGWNKLEGQECFRSEDCDRKGMTPPAHVYPLYRGGDCSVTGGYVYRGKALPQFQGRYFYADYCSGALRSFRYEGGKAADHRDWSAVNASRLLWGQISSLGRDREGELYLVSYDRGLLLKLVPAN